MAYTELKVGGVPEHFNLPWHLAIEKKMFEQNELNIRWKDYPGGTGAMCADLRSGELDIALVLTEGIVADIAKGNPSKIVQWYVTTPLLWGIHVPARSSFQKMEEVKGKRYAISRFGSGSHLMAYVDAKMRGWTLTEDQFVIVNNLEGAREAFKNNKADIFMWEKFMTKPLVDKGEFRRISERPTPWPCFAMAATNKALAQHEKYINTVQKIIGQACAELTQNPAAVPLIAQRYTLQEQDVQLWYAATKWAADNKIEKSELTGVMDTLAELKLIEKKIEASAFCSSLSYLI